MRSNYNKVTHTTLSYIHNVAFLDYVHNIISENIITSKDKVRIHLCYETKKKLQGI